MRKLIWDGSWRGEGPSGEIAVADPNTFAFDRLRIPGLVDIHIHGAFGIDFMAATTAQIEKWAEGLRQVGYAGFLPTTVTAELNHVQDTVDRLPEHPMIWGFHLEGPFISRKFPGAQPQHSILAPQEIGNKWDTVLGDPRLRIVTLAPEIAGGQQLVRDLAARGVIPSLGHTNATYADAELAFANGARQTTHTFNAMRGLHHREAGLLGYALTHDSVRCELIYDRIHVTQPAAQVLISAKPADGLIAISDATTAAGMAPGTEITMWGLSCIVGEGKVTLSDGTLAGSAITLHDAFRNLAEDFGLETAVRACCLNPRIALGRAVQSDEFVEFDAELNVVQPAY